VDKHARFRIVKHDVPQDEILNVSPSYGSRKGMLPPAMGGTVVLNQAEWIATRGATELEKI
jgi:hypothetical protein